MVYDLSAKHKAGLNVWLTDIYYHTASVQSISKKAEKHKNEQTN